MRIELNRVGPGISEGTSLKENPHLVLITVLWEELFKQSCTVLFFFFLDDISLIFPVRIHYRKILKVLLYSRYSIFIFLFNQYSSYPVQEGDQFGLTQFVLEKSILVFKLFVRCLSPFTHYSIFLQFIVTQSGLFSLYSPLSAFKSYIVTCFLRLSSSNMTPYMQSLMLQIQCYLFLYAFGGKLNQFMDTLINKTHF